MQHGRRRMSRTLAGAAARLRAPPPRLAEVLADRGNNFDLIRLAAAALVLYGHSFFEAPEGGGTDAVQQLFGGAEYAGSVAVYAFFLISGLLITASMEGRRSPAAFVALRFARIWPGFAVCAAVLVFVAVPFASGASARDPSWLRAALACWRDDALFPVRDFCGALPGAFPATPMPGAFGFSWWTLPAEVHCYGMVLALGLAFRSHFTATGAERRRFALATLALLAAFLLATQNPPGEDAPFHAEFAVMGGYSSYPVLFFFAGMLLYAFRRAVPVDGRAALALAGLALLLPQPNPLIYPALGYGVLALAAARPLRHLRPRHDLSYGLYIYGAAAQQAVGTLLPGRPAAVNFAVSLPLALLAALASWHLVEAPSLRLGRRIARRLEGWREPAADPGVGRGTVWRAR